MERFQGPINPYFLGENLNVEVFEQGGHALDYGYGSLLNTEIYRFQEEPPHLSMRSLEEKMPFLQMLRGAESPSSFPHQFLLRLQHQRKSWEKDYLTEMDSRIQALELESCITHDVSEAHSPVRSETKDNRYTHSSCCVEVASSDCNAEPNSPDAHCRDRNSGCTSASIQKQSGAKPPQFVKPVAPPVTRERRKRKRTRPSKNKEEVESQRMTHIAVERNRRRQMNDHLHALRSLMPCSFIQKGDQASVIGGAIDFVKELEQLLQSLEVQKKMRNSEEESNHPDSLSSLIPPFNGFFTSPQYTTYSSSLTTTTTHSDMKYLAAVDDEDKMARQRGDELTADEKRWAVADVEVMVIQAHVNLKILSPRRPGQLPKAIAALEDLRLTILHLNITSLHNSVLYSFNLKIEDECKLGSADEIAAAVHEIFSVIDGS